MMETLCSHTDWYKGVPTQDLVMLVQEAREQSEYCPDSSERYLWKERLEGMRQELLRRQELLEEIEI